MRTPGIVLTLTAFFVSLSACETTGDPHKGGLFGWSSAKADQRQHDFENQAASAQAQAEKEQADAQVAAGRASGLTTQVNDLHAQLDALLKENSRLSKQLDELSRRKKLAANDLERVRRELKQNQQMRDAASARLSSPAGSTVPVSQGARPDMREVMRNQNQQLQEEVMLLLHK